VPEVIFTTAYDQHALKAFEVNALDYLLKPIAPARLAAALQKVRGRQAPLPDQIFLRDDGAGFCALPKSRFWNRKATTHASSSGMSGL
jgi:DNA-binding LytR/AlgR family response regulator